jgi:hypothetical protein
LDYERHCPRGKHRKEQGQIEEVFREGIAGQSQKSYKEEKLKWPTKQRRNARIRFALVQLIQIASIAAPHARRWKIRRILTVGAVTRSAKGDLTN